VTDASGPASEGLPGQKRLGQQINPEKLVSTLHLGRVLDYLIYEFFHEHLKCCRLRTSSPTRTQIAGDQKGPRPSLVVSRRLHRLPTCCSSIAPLISPSGLGLQPARLLAWPSKPGASKKCDTDQNPCSIPSFLLGHSAHPRTTPAPTRQRG
jgi:hypothetical protein